MSARGRLCSAALIALSFALPATAHADANVDAAVATLNSLNLTPLTAMPSGRTTYRTIDDYNNEMQALATAHPHPRPPPPRPHRAPAGPAGGLHRGHQPRGRHR